MGAPDHWNRTYERGEQNNRYPFDSVVSNTLRLFGRIAERGHFDILDLGCGCGNNTRFFAEEGFRVTAMDGSPAAVATARSRLEEHGLAASCDFLVQDFETLSLPSGRYDFVLDRASVTHTTPLVMEQVYREIHRTLKTGGYVLAQFYSDRCSDRRFGTPMPDGSYDGFTDGYFVNTGRTVFLTEPVIRTLFTRFDLLELTHNESVSALTGRVQGIWHVLAQKGG